MIRLLLKRPVIDLELKNCKGKTAVQVAKTSQIKGLIEKEQVKRRALDTDTQRYKVTIQKFSDFSSTEYFNGAEQLRNAVVRKDQKITPDSFKIINLLGKGSFGEVYLVKKKDSSEYFAMKILDKDILMSIHTWLPILI